MSAFGAVPKRNDVLAMLASFAVLPSCAHHAGRSLSIGAKNFTEELVLGELYAQTLEARGFRVTRKFDLGGTQVAMEALRRGDIDLYPEYTGTALLSVLHRPPIADAATLYAAVKRAYKEQYGLTWLTPAPFNDTQALATTRAVSQQYGVRTLTQTARAAPQLRLGAIPEFTTRPDGLPGLQKAYGGFRFKDIKLFDIGLKYTALESGQVDIVVAFGTDGQIEYDRLVLLADDKHFWPSYQVAPVVRDDTLAAMPSLAAHLNALAPFLTDAVMRRLNGQVDREKMDPADAAHAFLREHRLA
ncbi:MAG: quaternary ammonium transporter [Candidatus Eremiobacteraeota bacterium]|nr:quaternary ammonium transporter [Candidatus Eremiobacteraeota bacterium]